MIDVAEGALNANGFSQAAAAGGAGKDGDGAGARFDGWLAAKAVLGADSATGGGGAGVGWGVGAGEAKAEAVGVGNEKSAGVPVPLRGDSDGCLLVAREEDRVEPGPSASPSRAVEARVEPSTCMLPPKPNALIEGDE